MIFKPYLPSITALVALLAACNAATTGGVLGAAQGVSVTIQPASVDANPADSVTFSAQVYGTADLSTSWRTDAAGGSIDAAGHFTAPLVPGVYHVVASSVADATASAVATVTVLPTSTSPADLGSLPLGAFPGCEGSGCKTRGGYASGTRVFLVTSLASGTGTGTLGACIAASGPRVCLFRVAGTIPVNQVITDGSLTIDATSAPPGGVQLTSGTNGAAVLDMGAQDVVLRGLRIRPGYDTSGAADLSTRRAVKFYDDYAHLSRIVMDHCSVSLANASGIDFWSHASSVRGIDEITLSYNLVGENFYVKEVSAPNGMAGRIMNSGGNSPGLIDAMRDIDLHHNFFVTSGYRNPEYKMTQGRIVNNYVYNWGYHGFDFVGTAKVDVVGNTFESGPGHETSVHGVNRPIELDFDGNSSDNDWPTLGCTSACYYMTGNVDDLTGTTESSDNWSSGVATGAGYTSTYERTSALATSTNGLPLTYESASIARARILSATGAGASYRVNCGGKLVPNRDGYDARIFSYEASNSGPTAVPGGSGYPYSTSVPSIPAVTKTCSPTTKDNSASGPEGACICADSNLDGIPDYWANAYCGSANGCAASGTNVAAPWTNLEAYLSGLKEAP
jgi:hypothetical protein